MGSFCQFASYNELAIASKLLVAILPKKQYTNKFKMLNTVTRTLPMMSSCKFSFCWNKSYIVRLIRLACKDFLPAVLSQTSVENSVWARWLELDQVDHQLVINEPTLTVKYNQITMSNWNKAQVSRNTFEIKCMTTMDRYMSAVSKNHLKRIVLIKNQIYPCKQQQKSRKHWAYSITVAWRV